jgi:hypothetical protein
MKNKILVLGAVITAFALTSFAGSGAALLRLPAAGNQTAPVNVSVTTIAYVDATAPISPRAQANQIKVVKGVASDLNPALDCRKNMVCSPKAVAECSSHATMPGCITVAMLK